MLVWLILVALFILAPPRDAQSSASARTSRARVPSAPYARADYAARAILLSVKRRDPLSMRTGRTPVGFEPMEMVVDVEIPGQPPFEVATTVNVPVHLIRDALPGAAFEVRYDPERPTRIVLIGSGAGFAPPQASPPPVPRSLA